MACGPYFALLCCSIAAAFAENMSGSPSVADIDPVRLRADLTFLASPELEGRMTLHRGCRLAGEFIAAELAKAGLQPIQGSFRQEFPVANDIVQQIIRITGSSDNRSSNNWCLS